MPNRKQSPEKRARQQLRDLRAAVRHSIRQLDRHPDRSDHILNEHTRRVARVVQQGRQQQVPSPRQRNRHKRKLPLWWSIGLAVLLLLGLEVVGGWAFLLLPLSWVVTRSVWWGLLLPYLIMALFVGFV